MGVLGQIAKIAKSHLPSEKRKKRRQKAKEAGIASFRDRELARGRDAGRVTKAQEKALKPHKGKPGGEAADKKPAPKPDPKPGLAPLLIREREKKNRMIRGEDVEQ